MKLTIRCYAKFNNLGKKRKKNMSMKERTKIEHPVDVQYLMHKAYEKVALLIEGLANDLQKGGSLDTFKEAFGLWGKHLHYHAQIEDEYMTGPIKNNIPARNNELEHIKLRAEAESFGAFLKGEDEVVMKENLGILIDFEEQQHQELEAHLENVGKILKNEIGENALSTRKRRHLFSQVVALRVCMFDHFDNEETFVFPVVRKFLDEQHQMKMAELLLFDKESENPRWIIDLLYENLEEEDKQELLDFENKIKNSR
tara:strand:+ start:542 stop:1309 length:768 start_codon:yes stop_codon:yes gene_type:complete